MHAFEARTITENRIKIREMMVDIYLAIRNQAERGEWNARFDRPLPEEVKKELHNRCYSVYDTIAGTTVNWQVKAKS